MTAEDHKISITDKGGREASRNLVKLGAAHGAKPFLCSLSHHIVIVLPSSSAVMLKGTFDTTPGCHTMSRLKTPSELLAALSWELD